MSYATPLQRIGHQLAATPDHHVLHQPANRVWKTWTWRDVDHDARRIAKGLLDLGLQPGDKVAIFGKNSAEWMIADWAIMMAGMISVPVYPTANADTIRYVMQHSGAKAVFVGKLDNPDIVSDAFDPDLPQIAFPYDTARGNRQWSAWIASNDPIGKAHEPDINDIMSIIYTSGSTGHPKGVVLRYKAYAANCEAGNKLITVSDQDRGISYLPLAHIAERVVAEGALLYSNGAQCYFAESLDTFIEDLQYVRPTIFFSVPRLWTRFLANIHEALPEKKLNILLKIPLLNTIIRNKIKAKLGFQDCRLWLTAAAPIAPEILRSYHDLGITICEAWGMTETTGGSCIAYPYDPNLIGTIGFPTACVEMKISDEDEILIRGDAVFDEYYNNPDATKDSFTDDGWFKTGDRGAMTRQGAFRIIGRVKEEFKTAKGKYVAPVPIETLLAANPAIEQICVMGAGKAQPFVVVVVAEHLPQHVDEDLRATLRVTFNQVNAGLEPHQRLSHMVVSTDPWTIDNAMLTPTMKIRRSEIEKRFARLADAGIADQPIAWESELQTV